MTWRAVRGGLFGATSADAKPSSRSDVNSAYAENSVPTWPAARLRGRRGGLFGATSVSDGGARKGRSTCRQAHERHCTEVSPAELLVITAEAVTTATRSQVSGAQPSLRAHFKHGRTTSTSAMSRRTCSRSRATCATPWRDLRERMVPIWPRGQSSPKECYQRCLPGVRHCPLRLRGLRRAGLFENSCPHDGVSDGADNGCQAPGRYVDGTRSTGVASDVSKGSAIAYYSYEACGAQDCSKSPCPDDGNSSGADSRCQAPWCYVGRTCSTGATSMSPRGAPLPTTAIRLAARRTVRKSLPPRWQLRRRRQSVPGAVALRGQNSLDRCRQRCL
jgi:hypothetical protein